MAGLCHIERLAQRPPGLDLFRRNFHQVEVEHRKSVQHRKGLGIGIFNHQKQTSALILAVVPLC